MVPLDEDAQFNPRGAPSRACYDCHREYNSWRSRNSSLASSVTSSSDAPVMPPTPTSINMPPTPKAGLEMAVPTSPVPMAASPSSTDGGGGSTDPASAATLAPGAQPGGVAASVPRNWNWSTF